MPAFDLTLRIIHADVIPVYENDPENPAGVQFVSTVGTELPFAGPDGQQIIVPLGVLRLPFNKAAAETISQSLAEEAAKVKERPNIETATSLAGVEQAADFDKKLRG